jgi:hypothetical protein
LPSSEQLAALRAWIGMGRVPYVDFAVWCANGARLSKFRKTEASVLVGDTFVRKLVEGPGTFEAWSQSWSLFAVAMVTLGEASLGSLQLYYSGVVKLMRLFPDRWPVLLTTDVIVRSERWGALREAFERNPPPHYDPRRPWDAVVAASAYGAEGTALAAWWQDYFVIPNTTMRTAAAASSRVQALEDGPRGSDPRPRRSRSRSRRGTRRRRGQQGAKAEGRTKTDGPKQDARTGEVCDNWNKKSGGCAGTGPCVHNRRHVCSLCGGSHRASDRLCGERGKGGSRGPKDRK